MNRRLSWVAVVMMVTFMVVMLVRSDWGSPTLIGVTPPVGLPLPSGNTPVEPTTYLSSPTPLTDEPVEVDESGMGDPTISPPPGVDSASRQHSSHFQVLPDFKQVVMVEGDTAGTPVAEGRRTIPRIPTSYVRPVDSIPDNGMGWMEGEGDDDSLLALLPGMNRSHMHADPPADVIEAATTQGDGWYVGVVRGGLVPRIDRNLGPFETAPPGSTDTPKWGDTTDLQLSEVRGANTKPSPHTKVSYTNQEVEERAAFGRIVRSNWKIEQKGDLEFARAVPPVEWYLKPKEELLQRWRQKEPEGASREGRRSVVRVACLYAGFMRDYRQMYETCKSKKDCSKKGSGKTFGAQGSNIVDSTQCDVYISTWDIVGAGRFFSTTYDMSSMVTKKDVSVLYKDRLGGLHIQKYAVYERIWKLMAGVARVFPQEKIEYSNQYRFWGRPEANTIFRSNDYSQSYKHWCVMQLSMLAGFKHDVYLRLRADLRTWGRLSTFQFAQEVTNNGDVDEGNWPAKAPAIQFTIERPYAKGRPQGRGLPLADFIHQRFGTNVTNNPLSQGSRVQFITNRRIHVQNYDYADFGFMGSRSLIQHLTVPWLYCLMPPSDASPFTSLPPYIRPGRAPISEYNLVLWRTITDNQWEVDDGRMYLRVNRMRGAKR